MAKTVEEISDVLRDAYIAFHNKKISYPEYQSFIQEAQKKYPEQFAVIQDSHTDAMNDRMNESLFGDYNMPFDAELAQHAGQKIAIPFGYENEDRLGANLWAAYRFDNDAIRVGGKGKREDVMHEAFHSKLGKESRKIPVEYKGDKPIYASEEYVVRLADLARGLLDNNEELVKETEEWIKSEGYRKTDQQDLLRHLGVALNEITKQFGISEKDKSRLIQSYEDRNGFIFDFDSSVLDYRGNYDKEDIQEWVDTTPLAKEVRRSVGVGMVADLPEDFENFTETGFEPTIE